VKSQKEIETTAAGFEPTQQMLYDGEEAQDLLSSREMYGSIALSKVEEGLCMFPVWVATSSCSV
jgi:hypothetical protein